MSKARGLLLMLLFGAQSAAAPFAWAEALSLQTILSNVSVQAPAEIGFVEQRQSALLKEPLELSGTLEYLAPGRLRKTIETPFQESVLIDGETIEINRAGKSQRLSMRANRMMQALLGGIAALLAGDSASLEDDFEFSLMGQAEAWTLQLTPRNKRLAAHLQKLVILGDEQAVNSIRIQFDEEDWQQMALQHPAADGSQ